LIDPDPVTSKRKLSSFDGSQMSLEEDKTSPNKKQSIEGDRVPSIRKKNSGPFSLELPEDMQNLNLSPAEDIEGFVERPVDTYSSDKNTGPYLTTKEFTYAIGVINEKLNSLYQICRLWAAVIRIRSLITNRK
jgi:hypothetical protein